MQVSPIIGALQNRVRTDGSRPLLTWYGEGGARVEFSATTFANWVDKASNLLQELGWDDQPLVGAPLLLDHPTSWMAWVWAAATWQVGGELAVAPRTTLDAVDVAVVGPDVPCPVPGADTIACSLHPLGLGFPSAPPGVIDAHEVISQPDVHLPQTVEMDAVALTCAGRTWTHADLAADADDRRLVVAADLDPGEVAGLFCRAVSGHGSLVLVDAGAAKLDDIAARELATLA